MKHDKKTITKLIVLGAILLGLWVFIGIRYARISQHWKAKLAAEERAHAAAVAIQRASSEPHQTPEPTARVAALVTPVPPPQSDPFRPVIPPRTRGAAARPIISRTRWSCSTSRVNGIWTPTANNCITCLAPVRTWRRQPLLFLISSGYSRSRAPSPGPSSRRSRSPPPG